MALSEPRAFRRWEYKRDQTKRKPEDHCGSQGVCEGEEHAYADDVDDCRDAERGEIDVAEFVAEVGGGEYDQGCEDGGYAGDYEEYV